MQVKINGKEFTLQKPASFAEAWDVASIGERNPTRAFGAALGLCGVGRKLKIAYHGDPIAYAGKVIDALHEQGVPMSDILEAGAAAFALCAEQLLSGAEVDKAADFTDRQEEASIL